MKTLWLCLHRLPEGFHVKNAIISCKTDRKPLYYCQLITFKKWDGMGTKQKLEGKTVYTALDDLPYGAEDDPRATGRVRKIQIPEGITRGRLYRDVTLIALPSLVELILTQLTSMADQIMVGHLPGQEGINALAAVGLAAQPKFLLMTMIQALNVGATAMIARFRGQQNREKANLVFKHAILLNLGMSVLFMCLGLGFCEPLIRFMGGAGISEETLMQGVSYLNIQLYGFVPLCLGITVTAALRGIGDTTTPMVYNTVANVVNLFFNYVMIYGHFGVPKMGVAGASLATVIGQTVAFFIAMAVAFGKKHYVYLRFRERFRFDRELMGRVVSIGLPSMVEQLLMRLGVIIYTRQVTGLGDTIYAAHQICMSIQALTFMMGQAFASAATTLIGQSLGKRRYDMAAVYMRMSRNLGIASSLVLMCLMVFLNEEIIGLYKNAPEIIALGAPILILLAGSQPFQADQFIVSGGLRGAGDTRYAAVVTAVTVLGLRTVLCFGLIRFFNLGLWGAWIALVADQCTRTLLMALRYRSGKWKQIGARHTIHAGAAQA